MDVDIWKTSWWGRTKAKPSVYGTILKKVSGNVSGDFGVEIVLIRNFRGSQEIGNVGPCRLLSMLVPEPTPERGKR